MLEISLWIESMVTAKRRTLKATTIRVNLLRGNRLALEQRNSKMERYMKGNG